MCTVASAGYCVTTAEPARATMADVQQHARGLHQPLEATAGAIVDDLGLAVPFVLVEEALAAADAHFGPYSQERRAIKCKVWVPGWQSSDPRPAARACGNR